MVSDNDVNQLKTAVYNWRNERPDPTELLAVAREAAINKRESLAYDAGFTDGYKAGHVDGVAQGRARMAETILKAIANMHMDARATAILARVENILDAELNTYKRESES